MATYIFLARIRPETATIQFDVANPPLTLRVAGTSAKNCTLKLLLAGSDVALHVTTSEAVADVATLKNQIQTVANAIFDGTTYYTGLVVTVEITSVILDDPWLLRFESKSEGLEREGAVATLRHDVFFSLAIETVELRSALSDLREAVRSPNDTGFFAYRAVETIMQSFKSGPDEEAKHVWPRFRSALRVSVEYVKAMTAFSTSNRHGVIVPVSAETREELMIRARIIIHRFAEYLSRGRQPLSGPEFQELA